MFIDICLRLHPNVHPADGVLHGGAAEATRPEVELMMDATLGAAVVLISLVSGP
jgi:hypothetical protein